MAGVKGRSGRKRKHLSPETVKKLKCSVCGERKPLDEFYTNKARPSGRQTQCKGCNSTSSFEASCRREIKTKGVEAFQARINTLEDRATLMRRILLKEINKAK
jgi:hypothetical protein